MSGTFFDWFNMVLLTPLIFTAIIVRAVAALLILRGYSSAAAWNSWPAAAASGMGVVFISTAVTHFIQPQRSGLIAIVPDVVPFPELAVTFTGILEIALAIGLLTPRTRKFAAVASVLLLIALFPANIVAAAGVDHVAAPSTALMPRLILQLVFIAFAAAPLLGRKRRRWSVQAKGGEPLPEASKHWELFRLHIK